MKGELMNKNVLDNCELPVVSGLKLKRVFVNEMSGTLLNEIETGCDCGTADSDTSGVYNSCCC